MDTEYDPFEKHRALIEYLMLGHMSSFSVNTHFSSVIGYSTVLLKEVVGPLNDEQKKFLEVINHNTRYLYKHINTFITAARLIFNPQQVYVSTFDLLEMMDRFVKRIAESSEFHIEKDLPEDLRVVEGDANLIDYAMENLAGIVMQIHPDRKGSLKLSVREEGKLIKIVVSTNKDMKVELGEDNMELFVVQSVVDLHGGSFEINYDSENECSVTFSIPKKHEERP